MKTMVLSEEEIMSIESFMQEASNIPVVECIYLVPFFSEKSKKEKVDIITIWNESLYYNGLLTGEEKMRDTKRERTSLENIVQKYQQKSNECRLSFTTDGDWNYSLSLMHRREWYAEMALASGTILFDRFGNKTDNRNSALGYFQPQENILEIENIDKLITTTKESPTLKKTNK